MKKSLYKRLHSCLAGFIRFIFRIHVHGSENEPEPCGILLCSNHVSLLDPVCVAAAMKKTEAFFMAKKELFKIPVLSQLIKLLGAYPVERGGSDLSAVHKTIDLIKSGKCAGMFPQGTRCRARELEDTSFKTGAALIISKTDCPVLPIRICIKNNRWHVGRKIDIYIGAPITSDEIAFDSEAPRAAELKRITEILFDRICALGPEDGKK